MPVAIPDEAAHPYAGARSYLGQFLHGLASVARQEGQIVRSLRLGGAASVLRHYGPAVSDARFPDDAGCPPGMAEKEWGAGRVMSLEEAVSYALAGEV